MKRTVDVCDSFLVAAALASYQNAGAIGLHELEILELRSSDVPLEPGHSAPLMGWRLRQRESFGSRDAY